MSDPEMSDLTYAVGDVHGRLDLLERAFDRMAAHAGGRPHRVIMLGDVVDRGPESAGVIDFLLRRQARADIVCLKGNHEAMMLGALAGDEVALRSWLANGGVETLRSYGARTAGDMRRTPRTNTSCRSVRVRHMSFTSSRSIGSSKRAATRQRFARRRSSALSSLLLPLNRRLAQARSSFPVLL